MTDRAGGPEGSDATGSSPRSSAGDSTGASQQAQAGRSPVLDAAQLEVLRRYGSEHDDGRRGGAVRRRGRDL